MIIRCVACHSVESTTTSTTLKLITTLYLSILLINKEQHVVQYTPLLMHYIVEHPQYIHNAS